MSSLDLSALTPDHFETRLNETFRLDHGEGLALRLVEVRRHGQDDRPGGAFSLTFLAPPGPFLPQATYPLDHPALGQHDIFLVPLGPQDGGTTYEAVFG